MTTISTSSKFRGICMTRIPVPNSKVPEVIDYLNDDSRISTDLKRYVTSNSEIELRLTESGNDSLVIESKGMDRCTVYLTEDLSTSVRDIVS